jgi:hypothetical protein
MEPESGTGQTCCHLRREFFEQLGGQLWCVQCDGHVNDDGTVVPRAPNAFAPAGRNLGDRLDRFLGRSITLSRR